MTVALMTVALMTVALMTVALMTLASAPGHPSPAILPLLPTASPPCTPGGEMPTFEVNET
jgi:hypothetical protein